MNLEEERKLKYDRRLRTRTGWISDKEFESELAGLPDSADKIHIPEEEPPAESNEPTTPVSPIPGSEPSL
jgi:hypothetical protein